MTDDAGRTLPDARRAPTLDPGVELLPDVPISSAEADLLDRGGVALRLVELACALPLAAPRVVALTGAGGAGKTSVLNLAVAQLADRGGVACVKLDGADHAGAESLLAEMVAHLGSFFAEAGVVDATDAVRDTLAGYGEIVSSVARIAGVKVDVGGALRRSAAQVRAEIAEMTHEVGKRVVVVLDHVDRLPPRELAAALIALRHYAVIPYVTIVLSLDRRDLARRLPRADVDPGLVERLVSVELALPPPDRVLLARVIAGGLARLGARVGRDIDPLLPLFDPGGPGPGGGPDAPDGAPAGPALALVETPRDAKRVINAITAALPLWPSTADLRDACLDAVLRLLVPTLDGPLLEHARGADAAARAAIDAELTGHPRAAAARVALHALRRE